MTNLDMASMLDFAVIVVDDRITFANSARFPDASQVMEHLASEKCCFL